MYCDMSHHSFMWNYLILPALIFVARIGDVSLGTVRIILLAKGKRLLPSLIGFFEVLIWILVIAHLVNNISNWVGYVAYAGGFATGTYIGTLIEPSALMQLIRERKIF